MLSLSASSANSALQSKKSIMRSWHAVGAVRNNVDSLHEILMQHQIECVVSVQYLLLLLLFELAQVFGNMVMLLKVFLSHGLQLRSGFVSFRPILIVRLLTTLYAYSLFSVCDSANFDSSIPQWSWSKSASSIFHGWFFCPCSSIEGFRCALPFAHIHGPLSLLRFLVNSVFLESHKADGVVRRLEIASEAR